MNSIQNTNYVIYTENIKKDLSVTCLSDLHFSPSVKNKKLNLISSGIDKVNPSYVFISGDTVDSLNMIDNDSELERLLNWFSIIASKRPIIIGIGDHDQYIKTATGRKFSEPKRLIEAINSIGSSNIHFLDNSVYEDENIYVCGYTQTIDYFNYPKYNSTIFHPIPEDKERLIKELKELLGKIGTIPEDKPTFLLTHSPIYLSDSDIQLLLNAFCYYITGHTHSGCVFPELDKIWKSKEGIIAPNKEFNPNNVRNTLQNENDKLLTNGAMTTFQYCSGIMQLFNFLFPIYMSTMHFTNNINMKENKLSITKEYIR